jgi:hypothetical protein
MCSGRAWYDGLVMQLATEAELARRREQHIADQLDRAVTHPPEHVRSMLGERPIPIMSSPTNGNKHELRGSALAGRVLTSGSPRPTYAGIDNMEIIQTVHQRPAPMIPATSGLKPVP